MEIGYAVGMDDAGVDDIYQAIKKAKGVGRGAMEAFEKIEPDFMEAARLTVGDAAADFWERVKAFHGYSFNRGHAASYGVLAARIAYLKYHYPAEFFASILEAFPERSPYLAAAQPKGLLRAPGREPLRQRLRHRRQVENTIRVGLGKIHNLGPVAVREILEGQPFNGYDDLKGGRPDVA